MLRSKLLFTAVIALFAATFAYSDTDHVRPDPNFTPGATASDVTQDNIQQTICVPGFTKPPRRPPNKYTHDLKEAQLEDPARGYSSQDMSDYEEDHLIPLTIGGNPRAKENLWPQPYDAGQWGARKKDQLEVKLNKLICAEIVPLDEAQRAIARDWVAAYKKYMPMEIPEADGPADPDDQ